MRDIWVVTGGPICLDLITSRMYDDPYVSLLKFDFGHDDPYVYLIFTRIEIMIDLLQKDMMDYKMALLFSKYNM